jgi:lipopolysaccharide transport system ATP-binding protein
MNDKAISVRDISKCYNINHVSTRQDTLRDLMVETTKSLFRRNGRSKAGKEAFWALKGISFEVEKGDMVGFVGSNGAGKSTLLKILCRVTTPTTGKIKVFGKTSSILEVGTGFQPELTGRENIFLNGAILGMGRQEIRKKFDEIVAFAETEKFLDTPVKRYSSGMYVRLAFAVVAHLEPEILLIDEVLSVGDSAFQKKCLGKMGDVAREGRTVLFISHSMTAVNSLCKRVIWLSQGEIVEDGPSAQVVANYLAKTNKTGAFEEAWDEVSAAPGNDIVRLHRIYVKSRENELSENLTMQSQFDVVVEYWNLSPGANLHITLHLYTSDGLIAFTTFSRMLSKMPVGLFRSVCHFPGNLLNSGRHRFDVLVVKNLSSVIYQHQSQVSFDILDLKERDGTWYGKEPGVVQPLLDWETDYIGRDEELKKAAV